MILEKYNPLRTCSIKAWRSEFVNSGILVAANSLLAATRSSFNVETKRANTDSVINGSGTPKSNALCEAHLPVPLFPAVSMITSTIGRPVSGSFFVKISAVISIK